MSRLSKLAAVLLVALWLPATLHCRLEAAGLDWHWLGVHEHDAANAEHCTEDNCHPIEGQVYKPVTKGTSVTPPAESAVAPFLTALLGACDGCAEPALSPTRPGPPAEWNVAWQFSTRAAPSSQAP